MDGHEQNLQLFQIYLLANLQYACFAEVVYLAELCDRGVVHSCNVAKGVAFLYYLIGGVWVVGNVRVSLRIWVNYLEVGTALVEVLVGEFHCGVVNRNVSVYLTSRVGKRVREQPFVSVGKIEHSCKPAMVYTAESVKNQTASVAALYHLVNHCLRLAYAYGLVGCSVHYPQWDFVEPAVVL